MGKITWRVYVANTRQFGGSDHKKEFDDFEEAFAYAKKKGDQVTGFWKVTTESIDWRAM